MVAQIAALDKATDPPFKAAELSAKASALTAVCAPIVATPKPAPPPEPALPLEAEAPAADGEEQPPPAEEGAKPEENMDVD